MSDKPTPPAAADFERLGDYAYEHMSRTLFELFTGHKLREIKRYSLTLPLPHYAPLEVECFAEGDNTRVFWVVWLDDETGVQIIGRAGKGKR